MQEDPESTIALKEDSLISLAKLPERFESKGLIGQGGMGFVFRALDHELGREVAVKILMFEGSKEEAEQVRFLREAKLLSNLQHENIVKVFCSGITDGGNPYHVMELLDGEPLSQEIQRSGKLPPGRFQQLFKQVLSGLLHAHQNKIVHRDLKPTNIMISGDQVKIIDFGIARVIENEKSSADTTLTITRTNTILGSPVYMSPEQCRGSNVDHLSDIYSLGCIMYEALTGIIVFPHDSAFQIMYAHMNEQAPSLEAIAMSEGGRRLGKLIDRCLMKNPLERPQSVLEIQEELDAIFSDYADEMGAYNVAKSKDVLNKKVIKIAAICLVLGGVCIFAVISKISQESEGRLNAIETKWRKLNEERLKKEKSDLENDISRMRSGIKTEKGALQKARDPAERLQIVQGLIETNARLAQATMQLRRFKDAEDTLTDTLNLCSDLDGTTVVRWRTGLLIARAECRMSMGRFSQAESDLQAAYGLDAKQRSYEWNFVRTRINLRIAEGKFDLLESDLKKLPQAWTSSSDYYRMWSSKLFGTPYSLTDALSNIFESLHTAEAHSSKDKETKASALIVLADEMLHQKGAGKTEAVKAVNCLSDAQELLLNVRAPRSLGLSADIAGLLDEAEKLKGGTERRD